MKTLKITSLVLIGLALFISIYLTIHHYKVNILNPETSSFCTIGEVIDCDGVATSEYSTFLGIPVSSFGIFAYAFLWLLIFYDFKKERYLTGTYVFSLVMLLFSFWEMFASYVILKKVCIFCTLLYLLVGAITVILKIMQKSSHKQIAQKFWQLIKSFFPLDKNLKRVSEIFGLFLIATILAVFLDRYFHGQYMDLKAAQNYLGMNNKSRSYQSLHITSVYEGLNPEAVDISGSPYQGGMNAPVEIVVFGDFECLGCITMSRTLSRLYEEKGDKVKVVYKFFPLDNACNSAISGSMHINACKAAYLAYCAHRQNKFWEMYQLINTSSGLNDEILQSFVSTLSLNSEKLEKCVSKEGIDFVKKDTKLGNSLRINVTPTLFINKRNVSSILKGDSDIWSIVEYLLEK